MHDNGLFHAQKGPTQAEIGLTRPENRPNSNFRQVVACTLQESAEKNLGIVVKLSRQTYGTI